MGFRAWLESYGPETVWLKRYMQGRSLDLSNHVHEFLAWPGSEEVLDRLGVDAEALEREGEDGTYETAYRVEQGMTEDEKEGFADYLMQNDPGDAPTWAHFDAPRMLRPDTWLVHFTDDGYDVARKGFRYGMDDMTRLGLTSWFNKESKKFGGYNFAFVADGRSASSAASAKKYGKQAVMFRSAGVEAYHWGDMEDQVITAA